MMFSEGIPVKDPDGPEERVYECPNCGAENTVNCDFCFNCGIYFEDDDS